MTNFVLFSGQMVSMIVTVRIRLMPRIFALTPLEQLPLSYAGLASPFFFKNAVDKLVEGGVASMSSSLQPCLYGMLLYGGLRMLSQVSKELQMPLFTPVSQVIPELTPLFE